MDDADPRSILKRSAKRTLWVRAGHGSLGDVVVKRFHAPGFVDRWRDGARAANERRTLEALRERGLPVPEPLAIERHAGGVDLVLRSIQGAESLRAVVARGERSGALAREIGSLLARAALCGLRHPDLHAGNVLIDDTGRAWLVDLRGARIGGRFSWREHEQALVVLEGDLRESTRPRDRARVLIACLRELRRAGCADLPAAGLVARTIDVAARLRRRTVVERSSRRWLRASSVTVPFESGFRAHDADEALCRRALCDVAVGGYATERLHIVEHDSARAVIAEWRTAARLFEHGIPAAKPLAIVLRPRARALFEAEPVVPHSVLAADPHLRQRAAASLATLSGLLHDRALALTGPLETNVVFDEHGNARVALGARLRAADPRASFAALPQKKPEKLRRRVRARALDALTHAAAFVPAPVFRGALCAISPLAAWTRFERTTRANLELALSGTTSESERARLARGVRLHSARLFAEWVRLARGAPPDSVRGGWIEELVEIDPSIAVLERELALGRGALVVTAHIGNWELLAARLRRAGHRGAVVGFQRANDSSARWLVDMRRAYGVETIAQDGNPRAILRALSDGAVVGLLCDLEVRRLDGEFVPFFGRPAWTMTAPAALARAARVPLLPARCVLDSRRGRYHLAFGAPLALDPELERRARTTDLLTRMNATFERWIRADPGQWAWHQPRWRTRPGDARAQAPRPLPRARAGISLQSADQGLAVD